MSYSTWYKVIVVPLYTSKTTKTTSRNGTFSSKRLEWLEVMTETWIAGSYLNFHPVALRYLPEIVGLTINSLKCRRVVNCWFRRFLLDEPQKNWGLYDEILLCKSRRSQSPLKFFKLCSLYCLWILPIGYALADVERYALHSRKSQ